jgi:hypothetical protein
MHAKKKATPNHAEALQCIGDAIICNLLRSEPVPFAAQGESRPKPAKRARTVEFLALGYSRKGTNGRSERLWSGGRDSNSRSPGPKPEAKAYRIRLDLSAPSQIERKSLNSLRSSGRLPAPDQRLGCSSTTGAIGARSFGSPLPGDSVTTHTWSRWSKTIA